MDSNAPLTSWDFIKENYGPQDRVALVIRNRADDYTLQRLLSAEDAASRRVQRFLRYENAHGADIYISMNTLKSDATGRTKADVAEIRHLYLDLDEDGDERLEGVLKSDRLPQPNYVLDTSPGKHQVIWKVEGFTLEQAEAVLRAMARAFGGDPAATDAARVLRLPGLHNKKFKEPVCVHGRRLVRDVYRSENFSKLPDLPEARRTTPGKARVAAGSRGDGGPLSQSERDWAWVREQLRAGVSPDAIQRALAERRPDKSKPCAYAERTVTRALAVRPR